jgi:DNA-binding HxlR family transcriptional regulator
MSGTRYAQFCALARAAEVLGERWTLLIVRELLLGPKRFGDLTDRLDSVSPTVLTARLTALIESGVVQRATLPQPFNAQVYELTPIGLDLKPAIRELIRWGGHFLFPMRPDDEFEPDWVLLGLDAIAKRSPVPEIRVGLVVTHGKKSAGFTVEGSGFGTTIQRGLADCKGTLEAPFDAVLQIIGMSVSLQDAIEAKRASVSGAMALVRKLPLLFDLAERRRVTPAAD